MGYYINDTCALGPGQFKWFRNVRDLCDHVINVELAPVPYDEDLHAELRTRQRRILEDVAASSLSEGAREAINLIDIGHQFHWWGNLADLPSGRDEFSRETLGTFAIRKGRGCGVDANDMPAFLAFLRDAPRMNYCDFEAFGYDETPMDPYDDFLQGTA